MKVAFITGTSMGIGKSIAELLLSENYIVFGYSRTNTIEHPKFTFPKFDNSEVLLINNAARIGKIIPLNMKTDVDIINDYNLNIICPTILCAKFINSFAGNKKIIINISSGAANSAIASWSTYCATKSAIDSLTNVISEENHSNLTIFSVHPGVVDTQMQTEIRKADIDFFPLLSKFTNYYINGELEKSKIVSQKIIYIIDNCTKFDKNILSIRDIHIN